MKKRITLSGAMFAVLGVVSLGSFAYAATSDSTQFSQQINPGVISTFIGDATGTEVAAPNVVFPAKTVSAAMQTSAGVYGTDSERIYVDNPDNADNGWTLSLAATDGASATWTNGTNTYAFNGAADTDGQLTIDPSVGTVTAAAGTTDGVTLGTSSTFSGGTNTPVNLMTASAAADDVNRVYLTGVGASQTIPALTPSGNYTIDFTQTVVPNP